MKHRRTIAILAAWALVAANGCGGDSPRSAAKRPPAPSMPKAPQHVNLDFRGVPLDKALAGISAATKKPIRIHPAVKADWAGVAPKVYFRIRDLPAALALNTLLRMHELV